MEVLTDEEVLRWIAQGTRFSGLKASGTSLFYESKDANCIELPFPETPLRVTYFIRVASMLGIDDESLFSGALLWITQYDLGSPQLEKSGWRLVERMRQGFGENRPLDVAAGHLFRGDEFVDLNAFLLPCFVFGWDAYLVPSVSDYFIHISHDEYWVVVTRTAEAYKDLFSALAKFQPKPPHSPTMQRFCPHTSMLSKKK